MTSPTNPYFLSKGSHPTADAGRCAMEFVAYLAGEPHSDQPVCVSPVLRSFCIRLNDRLLDGERQKLRPYLARTIGTVGDGRDQERVQMCREFLVHQALPLYLDAAGRSEAATRLRALPDTLPVDATLQALSFARDEAWEARQKAVGRLTVRIKAELAKRGIAAADAVAAAAADAVAVAAAVADAAADAVAVAAAVAVAVADAAAAAAAAPFAGYSQIRDAVYTRLRDVMRAKALEVIGPINEQLTPAAFELLDRMLPTEVIQLPVVEDAPLVCETPGLMVARS